MPSASLNDQFKAIKSNGIHKIVIIPMAMMIRCLIARIETNKGVSLHVDNTILANRYIYLKINEMMNGTTNQWL